MNIETLLEALIPAGVTNPGKIRPGINGPLERSQYDAIPAFSCSVLKRWITMSSLPWKFRWWLMHRFEEEQSAALALGSALDCVILDIDGFAEKFHILTKDGPKRVTEAHRKQFAPKTVITFEQWEACTAMTQSLVGSPQTSFGADFKHTGKSVAVAELWGLPFKCEYDLWSEQTDGIQDLKTTRDASPESFAKDSINFGYDLQATLYLLIARALGFEKKAFNFVCVENQEPWTTKVYRFRPFENPKHEAIFAGCEAKLKAAVGSLVIAATADFAEDDQWEDMTFPEWAVSSRKMDALALLP
jgi:PDDEXK-like domain of unknown function (DUF3799)